MRDKSIASLLTTSRDPGSSPEGAGSKHDLSARSVLRVRQPPEIAGICSAALLTG